MTDLNDVPTGSLDAGAIVALGLLGAGAAVTAGVLLRDPAKRDACARVLRDLGVPEMGRDLAATFLVKLATSLSGGRVISTVRNDGT